MFLNNNVLTTTAQKYSILTQDSHIRLNHVSPGFRCHYLQKLQVAARLVVGCSPRTSVADMHERLTWLRVKDRLSANVLIYFHSIINTQTPKFLYNNIIYCLNNHTYRTLGRIVEGLP